MKLRYSSLIDLVCLFSDDSKAIFLVGGFGSSEYLKSRLEQDHAKIQIIQPHGAWAAIVK
jgi:hypothetical protein